MSLDKASWEQEEDIIITQIRIFSSAPWFKQYLSIKDLNRERIFFHEKELLFSKL